MFHENTVFVLGSGSSAEAGLPTGEDLTAEISRLLQIKLDDFGRPESADRAIFDALRGLGQDAGKQHIGAANRIAQAVRLSHSIDTFLESHNDNPEYQLCGKIAIVKSILDKERGSKLHFDQRTEENRRRLPTSLDETWFPKFFKILNERVYAKDVEHLFDGITFINFNYDRCLEVFLSRAIDIHYGIGSTMAESIVDRANIFHPYGFVGPLPSRERANGVPFGDGVNGARLIELSRCVQTYGERVTNGDVLSKVREAIANSEVMIFLGFAFHPQNMALLAPPPVKELIRKTTRVYATTKGISDADREIVSSRIISTLSPVTQNSLVVEPFRDMSCADFFGHYRLTLSRN